MSSLTRHYERDDCFARLLELNRNPEARNSRDRALLSVLGGVPEHLDVLDAGCGLGGFSHSLRGANRITAVDVNKQCLFHVADRFSYATQCFDLEEDWPLAASAYDLVLFGDVLEHLFATTHVLTQAKRVLRPHGRIAVAVPNVGYWWRRLRLLVSGELTTADDEHIRFFSPSSLASVAGLAGLRLSRCRAYAWNSGSGRGLPLTLAWGFVALLHPR